MQRLKLKEVKITFKDCMIKAFGGEDTIDYISTKMSCAGGKNFVLEIHYELFNNEIAHVETHIFKTDEILSIEQRWC